MTENDWASVEYQDLLDEIKMHSKRVHDINMLFLGSSYASLLIMFITSGFHVDISGKWYYSLVFIVPFIVIIPSIGFITSTFNSIVRIYSYIILNYETGSHRIHWQTSMQLVRMDSEGTLRKSGTSLRTQYYIIFWFFYVPGIYNTFMILSKPVNNSYIILLMLIWLIVAGAFFRNMYEMESVWWKEDYFRDVFDAFKKNISQIRNATKTDESLDPFKDFKYLDTFKKKEEPAGTGSSG